MVQHASAPSLGTTRRHFVVAYGRLSLQSDVLRIDDLVNGTRLGARGQIATEMNPHF